MSATTPMDAALGDRADHADRADRADRAATDARVPDVGGERTVRTTCPYCGVGCGVEATLAPDGTTSVRGDPAHPANLGRLCSKGAALAETLDTTHRLLRPRIDGIDVDWPTALDRVADTFRDTVAEHGPDSVAFYVSGQLLTEDYYVVNKLVKGWLGTANIDTNSRLCMASSVAGHKRAFGSDTVPGGYEDLELADLVVLVGSNLAWCHPVLHQRLAAARAARPDMRVVLIDPRRTATAELADVHLAVAPDSDAALFVGLLAHLGAAGLVDGDWSGAHTRGLDDALAEARALSTLDLLARTGLERQELLAFYALFAERRRTVTVFSQGVNQSERGTDTVNAILNCHLATGRIGKPGAGPFSITGQPNAMGGREVGGLSNTLAAHLELERPGHRALVQGFWRSPRIADAPGPKAVELFERVRDGRIRALWIMATNPAVSLPDGDRVNEALARCPFVVVSDVVRDTDTLRHATVALPAAAWGEKDGTVTNSERRVSRQRALRPPPGEARADWWALCEVAKRLGWGDAFDYPDPSAIFREHAALSAHGNDEASGMRRDFDIGACAALGKREYDALEPFRWPWRAGEPRAETRFFAEGGFFTPDRRARVVPIAVAPTRRGARDIGGEADVGRGRVSVAGSRATPDSAADTLVLNTGRVRDQWHTMTRTGHVARLGAHIAEPFAELHPLDAAARGIGEAEIVEIESPFGRVLVRALLTDRQRPGSVFVPMHWSAVFASSARVDAVVAPRVDPVSGQPASKSTPVHVRRAPMRSYGFAVIASPVAPPAAHSSGDALLPTGVPDDAYWAIAPCEGGWRVEFADRRTTTDAVRHWLPRLLRLPSASGTGDARATRATPEAALSRFDDAARGVTHAALFDGARLLAAIHLGPTPVTASRAFCSASLAIGHETPASRLAALLGRPADDVPDQGAIVCSCLGIGARRILDVAADERSLRDVEAIGARLGAGTCCGSCRGEIAALLRTLPADVAPTAPTSRSIAPETA